MAPQPYALLWLKRDLRLHDHPAWAAALATGLPLVPWFSFEPHLFAAPDAAPRHWAFAWQCLMDLQAQLAPHQQQLWITHAEGLDVLEALRQAGHPPRLIFSHQETGNGLSYARDRAVARWCRQHGIPWHQIPTDGIQRGLQDRSTWVSDWERWVTEPQQSVSLARQAAQTPACPIPPSLNASLQGPPVPADFTGPTDPAIQPGGERKGQRYLQSFLGQRAASYRRHISRPHEARRSCSRLSPYIAWGALGVRHVWQASQANPSHRLALREFESRLRWRSHFMQKLESAPEYEYQPINPAFVQLEQPIWPERIEAWRSGQTGVPLVDACIRCLRATGWLNFRMRALVVSYATHHLWQPWQAIAAPLAQLFIDYEPGIHYAQLQMQAGTVGTNIVRIYNPVLNAEKYDPDGQFIRQWVPELAHLPPALQRAPWRMRAAEAQMHGFELGHDYPAPLVDLERAARHARQTLYALRDSPEAQQAAAHMLPRLSNPRKPHHKPDAQSNQLPLG